MMNLDPVPPIPPAHLATVELMALLPDPAACKRRMGDLVGARSKAVAAHAEATDLRADVIEKQWQLAADMSAWEQAKTSHSQYLADAGAALDKRAADLAGKERQSTEAISARESAHQAAVDSHNRNVLAFADRVGKILTEIRVHVPA
jgi:hypothetical protein